MQVIPLNGQTWLICGGRKFWNESAFEQAMAHLTSALGCPSKVLHGDASGADTLGKRWGKRLALEVIAVPAQWPLYGDRAGSIHNQRMLDEFKPDLVVAFPGGTGTADMVRRAKAAGVEVKSIEIMELG